MKGITIPVLYRLTEVGQIDEVCINNKLLEACNGAVHGIVRPAYSERRLLIYLEHGVSNTILRDLYTR